MRRDSYHQFIWCLYDWAHSVWPVLIITFVFPNYFTQSVAETPLQGTLYWGYTLSISGIIIAVLAPISGVITDTFKNSTTWFRGFTLVNILSAFMLWFVLPDPAYVTLALTLVIIGSIAFELSSAIYNTYLTDICDGSDISRISGIGWGVGYIAGIICLVLCLITLVLPDTPMYGLIPTTNQANIRIIGPIVGLWYFIFAIPILRASSDNKISTQSIPTIQLIKMTYRQLCQSINLTKNTKYIYYYLLVRMIYTDGINTLFSFAGIYAASTFGMGFEDILYFGIACNISAGLGCFIASYVDSKIGERLTLLISLAALSIITSLLLMVNDYQTFWNLALISTLFVGPIQTSSRSLMAKISPESIKGELFGLYALSGRITAFLGPALLTMVTRVSQSQVTGMATIIIFFVIGFIGLLLVKIPSHLILQKSQTELA